MPERVRQTTCPGIGEYYSKDNDGSTKHEIRLFTGVEEVPVTLREDQCGVVHVTCPFYRPNKVCTRVEDWDFLRRVYHRDLNPIGPVCRFALAATRESSEVWTPAFKTPDMYRRIWEGLSPQAKTACVEMSQYANPSVGENFFRGMCRLREIGRDHKDVSRILEEMAENGVVEVVDRLDTLEAVLKRFGEDYLRAAEVNAKGKSSEAAIAVYEQQGDRACREAYACLMAEWNDPELADRVVESMRTNLTEEHISFTPGFESFVKQFYCQYGFPLNFMTPRDPEY